VYDAALGRRHGFELLDPARLDGLLAHSDRQTAQGFLALQAVIVNVHSYTDPMADFVAYHEPGQELQRGQSLAAPTDEHRQVPAGDVETCRLFTSAWMNLDTGTQPHTLKEVRQEATRHI
jgi:hypothetical protein